MNTLFRFPAPIIFRSHSIDGAGRGRTLKIPTINLALADIPRELKHGVYAARVSFDAGKTWLQSATHYGPRPVFHDTESFELHILDEVIRSVPDTIEVQVIARLRDVQNFASPEALKTAIVQDISQIRAILSDVC